MLFACVALATSIHCAEATKDVQLSDLGPILTKRQEATTSAQVQAFQKKAAAMVKGKTVEAEIVVDDVSAVVFQKKSMYNIAATYADPALQLNFYVGDAAKALQVNKGDAIKLRGTGHAVFFNRGDMVVVKDAEILEIALNEDAETADMSVFASGDEAEEEVEVKDAATVLAEIKAMFVERKKLTTSAQTYVVQKSALKKVKGKPITVTTEVSDVRAVVWRKKEVFSVDAMSEDPAFKMSFYVKDSDAALEINVGDQITMSGKVLGVYFGAQDSLVVDEAIIQQDPTP